MLDFINDPQDILEAFQPYYQTAELTDVSDPNLVYDLYDLYDKLKAQGIFQWHEAEQLCTAFFIKSKSNAALSSIYMHARDRWRKRYTSASDAYKQARAMFERTKATGDVVLITNEENCLAACKQEKDGIEIFKKDFGSFTRYYEFMSQIVDYEDKDLEKLNLYGRHLRPLLRETEGDDDDDVDLSNVMLSHYRLSKIRHQDLKLQEDASEYGLEPGSDIGSAKARDRKDEFLSAILRRLNDLFVTDGLSDGDMLSYARTVSDKLRENERVMQQIENNSPEQAFLGDFPQAIDDAVLGSSDAHQNQMMQILSSPHIAQGFARVVFDMLIQPAKS